MRTRAFIHVLQVMQIILIYLVIGFDVKLYGISSEVVFHSKVVIPFGRKTLYISLPRLSRVPLLLKHQELIQINLAFSYFIHAEGVLCGT